jgi:hypothetical protein
MGKLQAKRFLQKTIDIELAKRLSAGTRRDYLFFLEEIARFVLGLEEKKAKSRYRSARSRMHGMRLCFLLSGTRGIAGVSSRSPRTSQSNKGYKEAT